YPGIEGVPAPLKFQPSLLDFRNQHLTTLEFRPEIRAIDSGSNPIELVLGSPVHGSQVPVPDERVHPDTSHAELRLADLAEERRQAHLRFSRHNVVTRPDPSTTHVFLQEIIDCI